MTFPLISEYIESIKSAEDNFATLTNLRPVLDQNGEPIMSSGNFAVVFKMIDLQSKCYYGVKCFLRQQDGRSSAYNLISEELKKHNSRFLVDINYYENELFVDSIGGDSKDYPILVMEWVDGCTLTDYLRTNDNDTYRKSVICYEFSLLANWLIGMPFAHGDIKPDNIIVTEDVRIVLVDYDGMYVPAMQNMQAREYGSIDYQVPDRPDLPFGKDVDDLALTSIQLSLLLKANNGKEMKKYENEDGLLFTHKDYIDFSRINEIAGNSNDVDVTLIVSCLYLILRHKISLSNMHHIFEIKSPIDLVPYHLSSNELTFYSKNQQKILSNLRFTIINPIDKTFAKSSGYIVTQKYIPDFSISKNPHYKSAYISKIDDLNKITWYESIETVDKSYDYLKIKSYGGYGILKSNNEVIVETKNEYITYFYKGSDIFFIIQKDASEYIIYNPRNGKESELYQKISQIYKFPDFLLLKKDNANFLFHIKNAEMYVLPDKMIGIEDIQNDILLINVRDDIYALYDISVSKYISKKCYSKLGWGSDMKFKDNFILCKNIQTKFPVLLDITGNEYPLEINEYNTINQNGNRIVTIKKYENYFDYFLMESGKLILKDSIPYKSGYRSVSGYIDDNGITFRSSYCCKYGNVYTDIKRVDFNGNELPISKELNSNRCRQNYFEDIEQRLKTKYLNDDYIKDFSKMTKDEYSQWGTADYQFWVVPNRFLSEIRGVQLADEYSYEFTVGYADDNYNYWEI